MVVCQMDHQNNFIGVLEVDPETKLYSYVTILVAL